MEKAFLTDQRTKLCFLVLNSFFYDIIDTIIICFQSGLKPLVSSLGQPCLARTRC